MFGGMTILDLLLTTLGDDEGDEDEDTFCVDFVLLRGIFNFYIHLNTNY